MSVCGQETMRYLGFGTDATGICNSFLVNEAEAAAAWALTSKASMLSARETFILLDCGGGATGVGTYAVADAFLLILGAEVTRPTGAVCGAADLNDNMKQVAMYHLKEATYLQDLETGLTLENIVDAEIMTFFETDIKRSFKLSQTNSTFTFRLRGLQKSDTNPRIWNNALVLSYQDMLAIFQQSLDTIKDLMNSQITHALDNDILVHRVVLLGGYGDSPALKELLTASLSATNNARGTNIVLVTTAVNTAAGAVATGGIIRAQDKDNGPKRVPRQSIGIKRHYPDEPVTYTRDVLSQGWERNKTNGYWYTRNTIEGDVKAGEGELQPVHSINFKSQHEFKPENKKWIPKENLFASDTCTPDFYTRQHVKNRGQTAEIGSVQFDITHLKDKIEMQAAPYMRTKWYEVELLIETKVIDRNLAFTALACQRPERCCDSRQPGLLQLGVGFRSQKPPEALQALVSGIF